MTAAKKVFLVEQSVDVLNTVKTYLREDDIGHEVFGSVIEALASSGQPAMIVLLCLNSMTEIERALALIRSNHAFIRTPKILVLPLDSTIDREKVRLLDIQELFTIPVERLRFQATVLKFLRQSPRRVFRILVTIMRKSDAIRYSGVSIDFSDSGMAFECNTDFPVDEQIQISFVNPRTRLRLLLDAKVVRKTSTPAGKSIFYGAGFRDLSEEARQKLADFISGT